MFKNSIHLNKYKDQLMINYANVEIISTKKIVSFMANFIVHDIIIYNDICYLVKQTSTSQ